MKIVSEGQNPYIKQARCESCGTTIEVDIRKDCESKQVRESMGNYKDHDGLTCTTWRSLKEYRCTCPICEDPIVTHREIVD